MEEASPETFCDTTSRNEIARPGISRIPGSDQEKYVSAKDEVSGLSDQVNAPNLEISR
jgi:hypothetical protein